MSRSATRIGLLAVLALALAACGGGGDDGGGGGEATTSIAVTGTDSLAFEPTDFTVPAGEEVTVELTSEAGVEHDFVVEDVGGDDVEVASTAAGESDTGTITIDDAGSYTFYCAVPGHRDAGMEGTLEVVDEG